MIKKLFNFDIEKETIAGLILTHDNSPTQPQFVFLHGAGTSTKESIYSIAEPIIKSKKNMLTFDFSGHGESTGILKKSSLKKRVFEATTVINQFANLFPLIVCGSSMGAYIAIKMLDFYPIDTLFLVCPALYDSAAYDIQFDQGFTEIIRKHESWYNTDIWSTLESFMGKLLIVIGEKDEVIPLKVIELIDQHTPNTCKKEIFTIANCPHKVHKWIAEHPIEQAKLHQKMLEYLT